MAEKEGEILPVIVDEVDSESLQALARTPYDAPEIDGVVHIDQVEGVEPGQIVHVEITDSDNHDLFAKIY